jgi:hypothetical protein
MHGDTAGLELLARAVAELVVAERREEMDAAVEVRELDRGDRPAAGRLVPALERVHDLARPGHLLDADELHPLDVADDSEVHVSHLLAAVRFT